MKFYSEITKQFYEDIEVCKAEEAAAIQAQEEEKASKIKLKEERANRAKEVEEAYKIAHEAYKQADQLMEKFLQDYGSFHSTVKEVQPSINNWFDIIKSIF